MKRTKKTKKRVILNDREEGLLNNNKKKEKKKRKQSTKQESMALGNLLDFDDTDKNNDDIYQMPDNDKDEEDEEDDEDDVLVLAEDPSIKSKKFKRKWSSIEEETKFSVLLNGQPDAEEFVEILNQFNIHSMAHGKVKASLKFFIFAATQDREYFYVEAKIKKKGKLTVVVKADNSDLTDDFVTIFKDSVQSFQ